MHGWLSFLNRVYQELFFAVTIPLSSGVLNQALLPKVGFLMGHHRLFKLTLDAREGILERVVSTVHMLR